MKKCFLYLTLMLFISGVVCAQTLDSAIDQARQIRLLEADRGVIRGVFHNFILNSSDDLTDEFSWDGIDIEVFYSGGECDSDNDEIWQTIKGNAHRIVITADGLTVDKLSLDLSKFQKEQVYDGIEEHLIYHDKKSGIAVEVDEEDVKEIIIFPSVSNGGKVCDYTEAKEFVVEKSWFGTKKLEERAWVIIQDPINVTAVELSRHEINTAIDRKINVAVVAPELEGDSLKYSYKVSGGKIIGAGSRVIWDLTGVLPGKYTITAAVDDGCGFCGQPKTETVTVK